LRKIRAQNLHHREAHGGVDYTNWAADERLEVNTLYMLPTIAIVLMILWALGFGFHVAGGLIHIVLVVALIVFVLHFVTGRRV
jgi:hypothetical protein